MLNGRDVIYCYDGSFDGLMCCVFESFLRKESPSEIYAEEPDQIAFSKIRYIETSQIRSERVMKGIKKKISADSLLFIKQAFLTCAPDKDKLILDYIRKGFAYGKRIVNMLADDTVNALNRAVYHCTHEAHLLKGFIRFSDSEGFLAAVISPKNRVIPLIADHFIDRLGGENFFIYDKVHRMAFVHCDGRSEILENVELEVPAVSEREKYFRDMWRDFYDAIEITERHNPRCRMNNMPKRFWENMTEMNREDKTSPMILENKAEMLM